MSVRVDPSVTAELKDFGGETAVKCFNCGNCTAVCSLTNQDTVFPRRYIRYIQLGLKEKMQGSLDPWLCYYCGDCSDTCPREAQPGKLMMASRRWLIAASDWTGLSRLMYRREAWELGMLGIVALMVLGLFTLPDNFGFNLLAAHPAARQSVNLHYFAPKEIVHWGDMALAALLGILLMSNAARMVWFVLRSGSPVPPVVFALELKELIIHGLTQKRWRDCTTDSTKHWLRHLFLVSGYGTMFALVVVFLYWFQVENASFHWTSLLGLRHPGPPGGDHLDHGRPNPEEKSDPQVQRSGRLALRDPSVPDRPHRHPAPPVPPAGSAHGHLRDVRRSPDDRGAHAGGGGALRQVGPPVLPAPGPLSPGGAGQDPGSADGGAEARSRRRRVSGEIPPSPERKPHA